MERPSSFIIQTELAWRLTSLFSASSASFILQRCAIRKKGGVAFRSGRLDEDRGGGPFLGARPQESRQPDAEQDAAQGEHSRDGKTGDFLVRPLPHYVPAHPGRQAAGELLHR